MNLSIKGTGSKTLSTPTAYCSLLELMLKLCQNNQDQSVLVCPLNLISLSLKLFSPPPSLALSPLSISLSPICPDNECLLGLPGIFSC